MKFLLIGLTKRISEEKTIKEITTIYIKRKMDYTDLNTCKIQAKYIKKIYETTLNEIDYSNKIKLRSYVSCLKFMKVFLTKKMS